MLNRKYTDLLFDLDNTLIDFSDGSLKALHSFCHHYQIKDKQEFISVYHKINTQIWKEFELGTIDSTTLRSKRFADTFSKLNMKSLDPVEANATYLAFLVSHSTIDTTVKLLLERLSQKYNLHIVTNGLKEVQRARLNKIQIDSLFKTITVSDEIGFRKPQTAYFDYVFAQMDEKPLLDDVLIIGDSLHSDIQGGILYGLDTCWINNKPDTQNSLSATYTLSSVKEIETVLKPT